MHDSSNGRVLVVDDDADMRTMMVEALGDAGWEVVAAASAHDALHLARKNAFDSIVTDIRMPGADGLELCRRLHEVDPGVPVIVVTAFGDTDAAVGAIRSGAYDFLTKPFEMEALKLTLARGMHLQRLSREVVRLRERVGSHATPDLIGESTAMQELRAIVERVGNTEVSVLIAGETGTGKELVARGIHRSSSRRDGKFVAVNCAAIPPSLIESTLFGHVKGAFSGAHADARGLFREAHRGTLFLDEVGELPIELQSKILRALQERILRPVGATEEEAFDVRLVSATNVDLEKAVANHLFRSDLLYRINVVQIDVPPLRHRGNDILLLAQHFVQRFGDGRTTGLTPEAAQKLLAYEWPGNVRELENCIQRALALTTHEKLVVDDLPAKVRSSRDHSLPLVASAGALLTVAEVEKRYILHVLEQVGGSRTRAASILGLDRKTLYRKLRLYDPPGES